MRVSWVISNAAVLGPEIDLSRLKEVGSFWGGWQTWRGFQTDNVICNDFDRASALLKKDFQQTCNFYIPQQHWQGLDRPLGVKVYDGDVQLDLPNKEDIISLHLASSQSDLVLMLGFDLRERSPNPDRLVQHQLTNYYNLVKGVVRDTPAVQWVLVDHPDNLPKEFQQIPNLTRDSLANVFGLLLS